MNQMSKIKAPYQSGIDLVFNTFEELDRQTTKSRFDVDTKDDMYTSLLFLVFDKMLKNGWTPKAIRVAVEDEIGDAQSQKGAWTAYKQELQSRS